MSDQFHPDADPRGEEYVAIALTPFVRHLINRTVAPVRIEVVSFAVLIGADERGYPGPEDFMAIGPLVWAHPLNMN